MVVWTAGALDAKSSGMISTAVSEPVVEHVVVDGCHGRCILLPLIFYSERHVTVGYFT